MVTAATETLPYGKACLRLLYWSAFGLGQTVVNPKLLYAITVGLALASSFALADEAPLTRAAVVAETSRAYATARCTAPTGTTSSPRGPRPDRRSRVTESSPR